MSDLASVFGGGFDANQVAPNAGFDLIPSGTQVDVVLTKMEVKPTQSGGTRIAVEAQVMNGEFQNRKLWDSINIRLPDSPKAEAIGKGTLSQICRCVGVTTPKDTAELLNRPLRVTVGVEKKDDGSLKNKITAYKPRHAGPAVTQAATPAPQTSGATAPAGWPT